jgi:hypothetical protein
VAYNKKLANEIAQFAPTEKIPNQKTYEDKLMKLYQKSIRVLGSTAELPKKQVEAVA